MGTVRDEKGSKAQGERLRHAREHWRIPNAAEAVRRLKLPVKETTYQHHENGTRGITRQARMYAEKFGVPVEWLLDGKNPPDWARGEMDLTPEEYRGGADHFLRAWRLFRNMTVIELAERIGFPAHVVDDWEAGTLDVSGKMLAKLGAALDTTAGSILDVDPAAVPPALLEMWRDHTRQQGPMRRRIEAARTGTNG